MSSEIAWGRILFWRICENQWDFQCESSMRELLFLNRQHSTDCSVLCHYRMIQKQFVRLSIYSDDDANNVCLGVCLLEFSVQFECAYESGDCAFCSLTIYCSFLVYSDSWLRTSLTAFWKWLLLSSVCKCNCFSDRQCYLCSSIIGLE